MYYKLSFEEVNCLFYGCKLRFMALLVLCHKMEFPTIKHLDDLPPQMTILRTVAPKRFFKKISN